MLNLFKPKKPKQPEYLQFVNFTIQVDLKNNPLPYYLEKAFKDVQGIKHVMKEDGKINISGMCNIFLVMKRLKKFGVKMLDYQSGECSSMLKPPAPKKKEDKETGGAAASHPMYYANGYGYGNGHPNYYANGYGYGNGFPNDYGYGFANMFGNNGGYTNNKQLECHGNAEECDEHHITTRRITDESVPKEVHGSKEHSNKSFKSVPKVVSKVFKF